jgi:hypothetical protein
MKLTLSVAPDLRKAECYLEERLNRGGFLSQRVRSLFRQWKGQAYLLLPDDFGRLPQSYDHGGVCVGGDSISMLAVFLSSEALLQHKAVVFEHALAKRGDPFLEKLENRPIYYRDEVYFVLNEETPPRASIEGLISDAFTAQGFTAFVVPRRAVQIKEGQLQRTGWLCRAIDTIVVGAFDNETFLFWQRERSPVR